MGNKTEVQKDNIQIINNLQEETSNNRWPSNAEHQMLRAEILQYMEEYQNLRNMMYAGTAALLGFNSSVWENVYLFLLPLMIILPSYIIYYDYWKSVSVASLYMQMFLERDPVGNYIGSYRWETLHQEFSIELAKKEHGIQWSGMFCHKIPYIVSTILCLGIYGYFVWMGKFKCQTIDQAVAIPLGLIAVLCSLLVFWTYRTPDDKIIRETWQRAYNNLHRERAFTNYEIDMDYPEHKR